jgi:pyruvate/2-oxoglutarate dehydrogenase complex dihydrolipoamide dehydrogenase (E3) component
MASMDKSTTDDDNAKFVTVDLPIRLSRTELERLAAAAKHIPSEMPASPFTGPEQTVVRAIERVTALIALRAQRDALLGAHYFGEPAWDMLLDLFIARAEGRKTSSTSAALASRAPTTTALRYISILQQAGLIDKRHAEHDLRVHYVALTDDAYRNMVALFSQ